MTRRDILADWSSLSDVEKPKAVARCRERLDRIGTKLNAVVAVLPSHPLSDGPLGGMPCAVKDMIATGASIPSWGLVQPVLDRAEARAPVLQCLDAAGADVMATAEMTSLAYEPSGYNAGRGRVLNPWSAAIVCGGSSSGSAVLVASGCCYAALGSDTGGSVRIPASCCGVTALKPTYGAIPIEGAMPLAPSLDTIGIIARSAADVSLVWAAITGETAGRLPGSITVAVMQDAFAASDPVVSEVCGYAASAMSQLGVRITDCTGFPERADLNALTILQAEAARSHRERLDDERIDAMLRRRFAKALSITDADLASALQERDALRDDFLSHLVGSADIAILPVMPIRTPDVRETDPASADFKPTTLYAMSRFTRFVNYLGLPALALPAGEDDRGFPVGLQLVGRPGGDALLLSLGVMFQSATPWHGRVPRGIAADIAAEGLAA